MTEPKPVRLTDDALHHALASLPQWQLEGAGKDAIITRTFKFADFVDAMKFVNRLAEAAENAGHHPDIDIRYNRVRLALVTHDAGGITQKDIALAGAADGLS